MKDLKGIFGVRLPEASPAGNVTSYGRVPPRMGWPRLEEVLRTQGEIEPLIARIREHLSSVAFTREEAAKRRAEGQDAVADLIERSPDGRGPAPEEGDSFGIVLLSGPDDEDTVRLDRRS
jgi:hypothetical protein